MSTKLMPHQAKAVRAMKNGCILCGGVGTGKSMTSLAYYYLQMGGSLDTLTKNNVFKKLKNPKDLYIITTARKRDSLDWEYELNNFHMSENEKINIYKNTVKVDSWNMIKKYENIKDSFFIFDEQRVVGNGAWVKSFLKIAKNNEWILLSATPGDTWTDYIPVFVANGFYKNRTEFLREHVIYSRFCTYPKVDRYINTGRLVRLRNRILVDMPYERKTTRHHISVIADYDKLKYKKIYKERFNEETGMPFKTANELCIALKKLVNSDKSRQIELLKIYDKHPKLIIFYNFDYELDILKNLSYGDNVEIAEWNGHKHQPIPETKKWVYLVQYNAGAEAWNCIRTDAIVFYSLNYSYRITSQSCGRIDRLNTPYTNLYYYHLRSYAPIDLMIAKALSEKRNFNEGMYIKNFNLTD